MSSRILGFKTPLQALVASISLLPPWTFGCIVYVHFHCNQCTKLDSYARRCLFLGYATNQKGYRCYDLTNGRLYVTMDVTFLESEMFYHIQFFSSGWDTQWKTGLVQGHPIDYRATNYHGYGIKYWDTNSDRWDTPSFYSTSWPNFWEYSWRDSWGKFSSCHKTSNWWWLSVTFHA